MKWWGTAEAAAELGISVAHMRRLCAAKRVTAYQERARRDWAIEPGSLAGYRQRKRKSGWPAGKARGPGPQKETSTARARTATQRQVLGLLGYFADGGANDADRQSEAGRLAALLREGDALLTPDLGDMSPKQELGS